MKTLYFDCFAGASGNMILGGLIALGVDKGELVERLKGLKIADFELSVEKVDRSGISGVHVSVTVPVENQHRHLSDIERIIDDAELGEQIKNRAKSIFRRLAEAEARVHGIDVAKVHFHEVGAMDAIVDVVGACIGFEILGIEKFVCSKIHVGSGFVNMAHGKYPVPPPAVSELLSGLPIYSTEIEGEMITPTGAAIISTLCTSYGAVPEMKVDGIGYGAGTRIYVGFPNVLRLMIGETESREVMSGELFEPENNTISERLILLETNIDDVSPQVLGFVLERALELGALDAWLAPIQMKKNRPAATFSVLCTPEVRPAVTELLYLETTTLGIRSTEIERNSLPREIVKVETRFGKVAVKTARYSGEIVNVMPEYEDVRRISTETGIPFRIVSEEVLERFKRTADTDQAKAISA